jgi:ribosomal protein S18 acetylase RimI-like enzyme
MASNTVLFRPVRPEDKDRIMAFTRNTWGADEDDYIKDVFDEWLIDPRGEFTAAVVDGAVVGISKLTDMGDDEWWLEGLRIDPAYRRRGIASEFNRYHVALTRRLGGKVIRYMTGAGNVGSQNIGARAGFQHIISYTAHLADTAREFALPTLLTSDDLAALTRWIDSPLMRHLHGVYRNAWVAKTLTAAELQRAVEAQLVYGLRDKTGSLTAWALLRSAEYDDDSEDSQQRRLRVDHLDGEMSAVTELARQIRALAAARNRTEVSAGISDYPPLVQAVVEAGYAINPDKFGLWVLELKLTSNQ